MKKRFPAVPTAVKFQADISPYLLIKQAVIIKDKARIIFLRFLAFNRSSFHSNIMHQ